MLAILEEAEKRIFSQHVLRENINALLLRIQSYTCLARDFSSHFSIPAFATWTKKVQVSWNPSDAVLQSHLSYLGPCMLRRPRTLMYKKMIIKANTCISRDRPGPVRS